MDLLYVYCLLHVCVFSTCMTEVFLRTSLQLKSNVCLASETPFAASLENEDRTSGMDDLGYNIQFSFAHVRAHTHKHTQHVHMSQSVACAHTLMEGGGKEVTHGSTAGMCMMILFTQTLWAFIF